MKPDCLHLSIFQHRELISDELNRYAIVTSLSLQAVLNDTMTEYCLLVSETRST